jgi:alpha-1,3-rhamnosyltransferase
MENSARSVSETEPLVTAVLVCWNHRRYVRAAIESVYSQTYKRLQVIVFDNGSTDGSRDELAILAQEHPFKLVLQENIGLVRTLNRGLQMAQGKYFAVLATDDIWLPAKIDKQVSFMEAHPDVHMTFGAMKTIDADGNDIDASSARSAYVPGEVRFSDCMAKPMSPNGPTIMCRTEILRDLDGYDEDIRIEDAALLLAMISRGYRVYGLPDLLTKYRRHETNWTSQHTTWPDICAIGKKYCRDRTEYRTFIQSRLRSEFLWLSGKRKREALDLFFSEPIGWRSKEVLLGFVKIFIPRAILPRNRAGGG